MTSAPKRLKGWSAGRWAAASTVLVIAASAQLVPVTAAPREGRDVRVSPPIVTPNPARVGDEVVARWQVTNGGPGAASGVVFRHAPPTGLRVRSATGAACTVGSDVRCTLGTLQEGAVAPVDVVYEAAPEGTWSLVATASARENDPYPANNEATETLTVRDTSFAPAGCSASAPPGWGTCATSFVHAQGGPVRVTIDPTSGSAGEFIVGLRGPEQHAWRAVVASGEVVGGASADFDLPAGTWEVSLSIGDAVVEKRLFVPSGRTPSSIRIGFFCNPMGGCTTIPLPTVTTPGVDQWVNVRSSTGGGSVLVQPVG